MTQCFSFSGGILFNRSSVRAHFPLVPTILNLTGFRHFSRSSPIHFSRWRPLFIVKSGMKSLSRYHFLYAGRDRRWAGQRGEGGRRDIVLSIAQPTPHRQTFDTEIFEGSFITSTGGGLRFYGLGSLICLTPSRYSRTDLESLLAGDINVGVNYSRVENMTLRGTE